MMFLLNGKSHKEKVLFPKVYNMYNYIKKTIEIMQKVEIIFDSVYTDKCDIYCEFSYHKLEKSYNTINYCKLFFKDLENGKRCIECLDAEQSLNKPSESI
jgi:hypothetical protein